MKFMSFDGRLNSGSPGRWGDHSQGGPAELVLEPPAGDEAEHLHPVAADGFAHLVGRHAVPGDEEAGAQALELGRLLEAANVLGQPLGEPDVAHAQDSRGGVGRPRRRGYWRRGLTRGGVVDARDLGPRHALGSEVVAEGLRDHDDAVGGAVGGVLEALGSGKHSPRPDELGRHRALRQDVLKPQDPRAPPHRGVGDRGRERGEGRRHRDHDVGRTGIAIV